VLAGAAFILIGSHEDAQHVVSYLLEGARSGHIPKERLDESWRRIWALKERYRLGEPPARALDVVGSAEHKQAVLSVEELAGIDSTCHPTPATVGTGGDTLKPAFSTKTSAAGESSALSLAETGSCPPGDCPDGCIVAPGQSRSSLPDLCCIPQPGELASLNAGSEALSGEGLNLLRDRESWDEVLALGQADAALQPALDKCLAAGYELVLHASSADSR